MPTFIPGAGEERERATASNANNEQDRFFSTTAIRSNLKTRSVRSGLVNLGSQGAQVTLTVGGTMILARLLRPADFGLYAMVGTLIAFIGSFRDFGLGMATAQREALNHHEYSALFWLYQKLNVGLVLFMLVMAPVLSWFYGQPQLTLLTTVMASGVFLLGLSTQQEALLKRQMRFPALTAIDITGTVLGVTAGIIAALLGAAYWALVIQFLTMCASKATGSWIVSRWRPSRIERTDSRAAPGLRKLITYGADITLAGIVKHIGRNLDRVLVGYFAGAQALGLYHHADKWAHFPTRQMYGPLRSVAVTGLSRVQNEPQVYRAYVRRGFIPVFAVTLPAIAFLFAEAERIISVLLGDQWMEAVPLFRILCIAAFVGKIGTIVRWLYYSSGDTRRLLRWDLISTPILVAAVATGARWGAIGVAIGFTIGNSLLVYPTIWYFLRNSPLRTRDFARILWRPAIASIVAAAVVLALQHLAIVIGPAVFVVAAHLAVFLLAYLVMWLAMPGGVTATRDLLQLVSALRRGRKDEPDGSASDAPMAGTPLEP